MHAQARPAPSWLCQPRAGNITVLYATSIGQLPLPARPHAPAHSRMRTRYARVHVLLHATVRGEPGCAAEGGEICPPSRELGEIFRNSVGLPCCRQPLRATRSAGKGCFARVYMRLPPLPPCGDGVRLSGYSGRRGFAAHRGLRGRLPPGHRLASGRRGAVSGRAGCLVEGRAVLLSIGRVTEPPVLASQK